MDKPYLGTGSTLSESWRTTGAATFSLQPKTGVTNPVILAAHVTDVTGMVETDYVADPFIVKVDTTWYMFYEVTNTNRTKSVICYSTSADGVSWTYGAKCLGYTESTHNTLSYPFVFMVDGVWWMIPCSLDGKAKLYRASTFPTTWQYYGTIVTDVTNGVIDSSIFQYGGVFYLLVYNSTGTTCRLFYSDILWNGDAWTEHPSSPILSGAAHSRPGGRPIVRTSAVDIYVQDGVVRYGNKLRTFQLTNLSKTTCTVTELASSPLLEGSAGVGDWNEYGMHQLDRMDATLSVVDGYNSSGVYGIGLYEDVP